MRKKILIVDDSQTIRNSIKYVLEGVGYLVLEASDGQDGLKCITSHADLAMVISDINMPYMNGLQMVEAIQQGGQLPGVPIVMLTTESSWAMVERAKAAGAKGWLVKPFKPEQLIKVIGKLTGAIA